VSLGRGSGYDVGDVFGVLGCPEGWGPFSVAALRHWSKRSAIFRSWPWVLGS
jgi:hypothetical protein